MPEDAKRQAADRQVSSEHASAVQCHALFLRVRIPGRPHGEARRVSCLSEMLFLVQLHFLAGGVRLDSTCVPAGGAMPKHRASAGADNDCTKR